MTTIKPVPDYVDAFRLAALFITAPPAATTPVGFGSSTVWPQASFSQRATCPPSAAVRQRSIALITFNCSRLTCPRLASRQAGP